MAAALTVYFSRTGNTRIVAQAISDALDADMERLRERRSRSLGLMAFDTLLGLTPDVAGEGYSPKDYDLVILGTPVWMMRLPSVMRSYLKRHALDMKEVAFFCTDGGAGGERVFRQMARLCGREPLVTLDVKEAEIGTPALREKVARFASALGAAAPREEPAPA